jgi:hypothetical protein
MVSSLHGRISILRHIKRTPQSETLWITEPLPWTLHLRMLSISRASEHGRNFGGSFDRKADMRGVNGRRVVDAVAKKTNDMSAPTQGIDDALFFARDRHARTDWYL